MKVVNADIWNIVLKCKHSSKTIENTLKSIWTDDYGNRLKYYNIIDMICIMNDILSELYSPDQKASFFDKVIRQAKYNIKEDLLKEFFAEILTLQIRKEDDNGQLQDLYQINSNGILYTIKDYNNLLDTKD